MGVTVTLRGGSGDMLMSTYDPDLDGVIAKEETEVDMLKSVYDSDDDGFIKKLFVVLAASDDLLKAEDGDLEATTTTPTKVAEITVPDGIASSTLRVKIDVRDEHAISSYGRARIYKNGVAKGAVCTSNDDDTFKTTSQDLAEGWVAGDLIQVYAYLSSTPQTCHVQHFRIYGVKNALHIVDAPSW